MLSFADIQAWSWRLIRLVLAVFIAALALGLVVTPLRRQVQSAGLVRNNFRPMTPESQAFVRTLPGLATAEVSIDLSLSEADIVGTIDVTLTRARMTAIQRLMTTFDITRSGPDWRTVAYMHAGYVIVDSEELDIDGVTFNLAEGAQSGSMHLRLRKRELQKEARIDVSIESPAQISNPRITARIRTKGVHIALANVVPAAQSAQETLVVAWPRRESMLFTVLPAPILAPADDASRRWRIAEVMSRFESTRVRVLDPLVTALMQSLPFLLLIALRRRMQDYQAEIAARLTLTTVFVVFLVGLGIVRASLDLYFAEPVHRLLQQIIGVCRSAVRNPGGAAAIGAAFVAWYWPLTVRRARLDIGMEPAGKRARVALWALLIVAASVTVTATSLECARAPWQQQVAPAVALLTTVLAIAVASAELTGINRALLDGITMTFVACALEVLDTVLNPPNLAAYALMAVLTIPLVFSVLRLMLPEARTRALLGAAVILCTILVAGPLPDYNLWWEASIPSMASALAPAIRLIAALFLLRLLRATSRNGDWAVLETTERDAGLVLALTFFFMQSHQWLYILVALAVAWLVFTRWVFVPRNIRPSTAEDVPATIRDVIRLNEAELALRSMKKDLRGKLAKAEIGFIEYERHVCGLEGVVDDLRGRLHRSENAAPAAVLSSGSPMEPWQRAMVGAKYGLLFAIPWLALLLRDFHAGFAPDRGYEWLGSIGTAVQAMGQWPLLGFFFGYFYPHLRGENGISKGLYLFLAVVTPTFAATALAMPANPQAWTSFSFWALQLFIHCMLLGVFAGDYETLRAAGLEWQHLVDVHNLGALTAWGSSVLIAVGAAATTAATSQAGALIMQALQSVVPEIKR